MNDRQDAVQSAVTLSHSEHTTTRSSETHTHTNSLLFDFKVAQSARSSSLKVPSVAFVVFGEQEKKKNSGQNTERGALESSETCGGTASRTVEESGGSGGRTKMMHLHISQWTGKS